MWLPLYLQKQITILSWIYLGQSLVGFGMGWTAPIILKLQDIEQTPLPDVIKDNEASLIGSLLYIGTIAGAHIFGYFSNRVGRKPCLMLGGLLTLMSFVMVVATKNLAMVYTVRIIKGMGLGMISLGNLIYIGEISSKNIRGTFLTMTGIFATFGTLIIYATGPYVSYRETGYIGGAISLAYIVGLLWIPETPVYKTLKGKEDDAKTILASLGRQTELEDVLSTTNDMDKREKNKATFTKLFTVKSNRKSFIILFTLNSLQQMSGVVVVVFFATQIFSLAGSSISPHLATIIIGITQLVASCIVPLIVERAGRKTLLLHSTLGSALSLAVLGAYFFLHERDSSVAASVRWLPLVCLIIFFLVYDFGFGIIPNTLTGELFNLDVRSNGSALVTTLSWVIGFVVMTSFSHLVSWLGAAGTFWIFAGSCAVASLFTLLVVPETKGKSLLEIQQMLEK